MNGAALRARVRDELLDRLRFVTLQPATVLDLGAGTGEAARELRRRYRKAQVIATDIAPGRPAEARRWLGLFRRFQRVCADAHRLPFRDASVDLIFSSFLPPASGADLDGLLAEIHRIIRSGGLFTFSTLGPDTLRELREAWAEADRYPHVHPFIDMHDIGDALGRAGFTEPVLDVDRHVLHYDDSMVLMRELKAGGMRHAVAGRSRGLTGRRALAAMTRAYEQRRLGGRLPATVEIVYGTAWGSESRLARSTAGEAVVPLSQVRRSPRLSH